MNLSATLPMVLPNPTITASTANGVRPVSLFELMTTGAGPIQTLTPGDAYNCYFRPADHVARFALGPDFNEDDIKAKIGEMRVRELDGYNEIPRYYVADRKSGIIEFSSGESGFSRGADNPTPVTALEKAFGVRSLPESLHARPVNNVFLSLNPEDEEANHYFLRDLINLFGALAASGAEPKLEIDPGYTRENIIKDRRHFYGRLSARFVSNNERVALTFSTSSLRWDMRSFFGDFLGGLLGIPGPCYLRPEFVRGASFFASVDLLKEEDRNTLEGHDVLQKGFEDLFRRFLEHTGSHHFQIFVQGGILRLGYAPEIGSKINSYMSFDDGLEKALGAFQMDMSGRYYLDGKKSAR